MFTVPTNVKTFTCNACGGVHRPGASAGTVIGNVAALLVILVIIVIISFAGDSLFSRQKNCESELGGADYSSLCNDLNDGQ